MQPEPALSDSPSTPRLSVVVITRDEERNLPRLLDSVRDVADEIIVFDSGSTDATVTLAEAAGARVVSCAWKGWSATKNEANAEAQGQWILSLDADEALTVRSRAAILDHIAGPTRNAAGAWRVGEINRLTNYCGRWVRHSGWHPDRKARLWPSGAGRWQGAIHERVEFEGDVEVTRMDGVVEHHSYPNAASHLAQIERFGRVWAEDRHAQGGRTSRLLAGLKVAAQWAKTFVIKLGVLDGRTGWVIARRSAWASWRKHARLRVLNAGAMPPPRRVLVTRTDALGDLVVTLPLVRALKEAHPGVEVDLLVRGYAVPVARQALGADRVVEWTATMADRPGDAGAEALRQGGYDVTIHAFPDAAVLKAAHRAGIPMRIATGRRWQGLRHATHRCWDSRKESGGHEAWHGLRLLLPLNIDPDRAYRTACGLEVPEADSVVRAHLASLDRPLALLHPGSHGSAGNWPPERFAELATRLADAGYSVGLTGTETERDAFAPHRPDRPDVVDFAGQFDLTQLMALQSAAALVVASSTGPLHTAAALGTPCVGLYGPAAPEWAERWAPLGPAVRVCTAEAYTANGALDLSVDNVMEACLSQLPTAGQD